MISGMLPDPCITKKMLKAGKKKGYERITYWVKGVRRHVYWCATSTKQGFDQLILAKWKSFMMHVANRHTGHSDSLFPICADDETQRRKWIKIGTVLFNLL
jgi:solute carrier family 8 (sodium/calcium exchanger)